MTNKSIYLVAQYLKKPRDPKATNQKNYWINEENARWDELVEFHTRIKDESKFNVVLDLVNQKVVKNNMSDNYSWEQLSDYFYSRYSQEIVRAVNRYSSP